MKVSDYHYDLPEEKIAKYPPKIRGNAKLLRLNKETGQISHHKYSDIVDFLNPGDTLILNNSKVIKARLKVKRKNGKDTEFIILEKHSENKNRVLYFGKLEVGEKVKIGDEEVIIKETFGNGQAELETKMSLFELAEKYGQVPIPPYMRRESEEIDYERYQTEFASEKGSVAAPTASLNFTDAIKQKAIEKGINICYLTLHVGLGTFQPIWEENLHNHKMHEEFYTIPSETIEKILETKENNKKVVALGTTVTRALEHSADNIIQESNVILSCAEGRHYKPISDEADIFIYPGYKFKIVDTLITNFHAPLSTVLMLTAAFAGWKNLKKAYEEALKNNYKFLSYGDSMLIE